MDFVSPESLRECIRLSEEVRLLPEHHHAKEDKLEVCQPLQKVSFGTDRPLHLINGSFFFV
jgi:hypothetical protein